MIEHTLALALTLLAANLQAPAASQPANRWEPAIAAFEKKDQAAPPAPEGIVFVGSSTIVRWNLAESFGDLPCVNRGFGGSQMADAAHFAERIIVPYKPRVVVVYSGDNDLAAKKTPDQVVADFKELVRKVHKPLPETRIVCLAIKPSPSRWALFDTQKEANRLLMEFCRTEKRLEFVDLVPAMLGEDGQPVTDFFVQDKLHLSAKGYAALTKLLRPHIEAGERSDSIRNSRSSHHNRRAVIDNPVPRIRLVVRPSRINLCDVDVHKETKGQLKFLQVLLQRVHARVSRGAPAHSIPSPFRINNPRCARLDIRMS
jgi:lysophospholipase L1-like esterase